MELLDTVDIHKKESTSFRLPVQYVVRPHLNFRGFSGTIASGQLELVMRLQYYLQEKHLRLNQ